MTFDNFYAGNSYAFEVAAAKRISEQPGGEYSPLIICGPCGVGKTHLLSAISARTSALQTNYKIICTSAEALVEELISSIREGKIASFREEYSAADMFLIDNFEFLVAKEHTQEELLNIFDCYIKNNKQIVLCIGGNLCEHDFAVKMKSRLGGGIVLNMALPDSETKSAIVDGIAKEWNCALDEQIKEYITQKLNTASEIKGVIKNIKMAFEITHQYPSLEDLKKHLAQLQ